MPSPVFVVSWKNFTARPDASAVQLHRVTAYAVTAVSRSVYGSCTVQGPKTDLDTVHGVVLCLFVCLCVRHKLKFCQNS